MELSYSRELKNYHIEDAQEFSIFVNCSVVDDFSKNSLSINMIDCRSPVQLPDLGLYCHPKSTRSGAIAPGRVLTERGLAESVFCTSPFANCALRKLQVCAGFKKLEIFAPRLIYTDKKYAIDFQWKFPPQKFVQDACFATPCGGRGWGGAAVTGRRHPSRNR